MAVDPVKHPSSPPDKNEVVLLQEDLVAGTPTEFRELLEKIQRKADLGSGQIAVKAKIPRSQAYNLVAKSRTVLPRKPEQVKAFVTACGLTEHQVTAVMRIWATISENTRAGGGASETFTETAEATEVEESGSVVNNIAVSDHGNTAMAELLQYSIADRDRSRRLLKLVVAIGLVVLLILGSLLVWAIRSFVTLSNSPFLGERGWGVSVIPVAGPPVTILVFLSGTIHMINKFRGIDGGNSYRKKFKKLITKPFEKRRAKRAQQVEDQRAAAAAYARYDEHRANDAYAIAADQLRSDLAKDRLDGLEAFKKLLGRNPAFKQTVISRVCEYLRAPLPLGTIARDQELKVRVTAQNLLASVLMSEWGEAFVDLSGAVLHKFRLEGCHLASAKFEGTLFNDVTTFDNATFIGTAVFDNATFTDSAWFNGATFRGTAGFTGAGFHGAAEFNNATFTSAGFKQAAFDKTVRFTGASFAYNAVFDEASFADRAAFERVAFATAKPSFSKVRFLHGVSFYDATLRGQRYEPTAAELTQLPEPGSAGLADATERPPEAP